MNKPVIEKCILSFSHDQYPSRREADRFSLDKARREIAAGRNGISHLILRAQDDEVDRLKFLFPIGGIPLLCYSMMNLLLSGIREIAVIGSDEVRRVLEPFLEIAGDHGKRIRFLAEDRDNLSLLHTLRLGRDGLQPQPDELTLFQPGDLPFLYDTDKLLRDGDIRHHNLILWLNSRQGMFPDYSTDPESEFVRRNYHYRVIIESEDALHDTKEPNTYPINLHVIESDIIELLHQTRKDGKILRAGFMKAATLPARFMRLLPVLADHFLRFPADMKRRRRWDHYPFGMHMDNFNRGASILLDTAFIAKVHNDPALVSDVDALEDWEDFEALVDHAERECGEEGLARIHPGGETLLAFREKCMPRLRGKLPLYRDFPGYLNDLYRSLEMGYAPFDARGRYAAPRRDPERTRRAFAWYCSKTAALKNNADLLLKRP